MKKISLILSIYLFILPLHASGDESNFLKWADLPLSNSQRGHIENDRILVFSNMETIELNDKSKAEDEDEPKQQKWSFDIYGLHPSSCRVALRRLSRYEEYEQHLSFIETSKYNENNILFFGLESKLLPFSMSLTFQLPRVTKPGKYEYQFNQGFLAGLTGEIHVSEHKQRCLFYASANWQGPHTGIPNLIFEGFSQALAKMAMQRLFRISTL